MIIKNKIEQAEQNEIDAALWDMMVNQLKEIYENKSSDEFKMAGDISKSPEYETLEVTIAKLSELKGFSKTYVDDLKTMFSTLHKPIWKKMVTDYMHEPSEVNVLYTSIFTTGYRVLVGELGRILASTELTAKGFVYKPDKISKKEDKWLFIRQYNKQLDTVINKYILEERKKKKTVQEAVAIDTLTAIGSKIINVIPATFNILSNIFSTAKELNPIALMNAVLSRSYDKKIQKYSEAQATYYAAKKAYDEYLSKPGNQQNKRVIKNYEKMIDKYEIKMNNLKASIDHYDSRANTEVEDFKKKKFKLFKKKDKTESKTTSTSSPSPADKNDVDDKKETSDNADTTKKETSSNDDFDF